MHNNTFDHLLEAAQFAHSVLVSHGLFDLSERMAADKLADAILAYDVQPRMPRSANAILQAMIAQRFIAHVDQRIELRQLRTTEIDCKLDQLEHELSAPLPEPLPAATPAWLRELMDK